MNRYFHILINLLNYKIQLLLLCVKLQESGDLVLSNSLAEMDFVVICSHRPSLFSSAVPPIQLRRRWYDLWDENVCRFNGDVGSGESFPGSVPLIRRVPRPQPEAL